MKYMQTAIPLLESKKKKEKTHKIRQHKMISWQYNEVLSETFNLCRKLNIIYLQH